MDRMILPLFGAMFLLLLGAGGMAAWDRHPPIGWHARVFGIRVAGFDLPDSLVTQRDRALADAAAARKQLAPLQQASRLRQAVVEPIIVQAKAQQARALVIDRQIMAVPPQDDACRFARAIDEIFLETLSR